MARAQIPASTTEMASGTVARRPKVRVYTRPTWTRKWEPANFLWPLQASVSAAPQKCAATFEWLVGRIKNADSNQFGLQKDLDLRDTFVKIVRLADNPVSTLGRAKVQESLLWVGRICASELDVHGVGQTDAGQAVARGRRVHTALGIEHELDRSPVRDSFVTNDGTAGTWVDAPLRFNEKFEGPSGLNQLGNRSETKIPHPDYPTRTAYAFAGEKGKTYPWTVADIINYLLVFYGPTDLTITLGGAVKALEQIVMPRVNVCGASVFEALNYLIDRRRGLGWCLRSSEDADGVMKFEVHVYSVLDEPLKFDDETTIDANADKVQVTLEGRDHLVDAQGLQLDTLGRFGKIVVAGRQVLSCFSLNIQKDETLEKGWTPAEETTYRHASNADDLPKNRAARSVDSLAHVYAHYHVPRSFTWKVGDGEGGPQIQGPLEPGENRASAKGNANPLVDKDGKIKVGDSKQSPVRNWGQRFERTLPFRKEQLKTDSEPEYLEPFALVRDGTAWVYAHDADPAKGSSGDVRMLDTHLGVEVKFTPNHVLAKGLFDQPAVEEGVPGVVAKLSDVLPAYDPRLMIVTVATRLDARLRVVVEIDKREMFKDRVLFLEVPDAELHYVVPGTVIGIQPDGTLKRSVEQNAILRDDGPRLRRIAALAKAWYGKERSALGLTLNTLSQQYRVGSLVQSVSNNLGVREVNTPVSQVVYDLVRMKTTIRTNWSELDPTAGRSIRRT